MVFAVRKFDTKVQHLKYKVLREVARLAWGDELLEHITDIPKTIVPGNEATMRCCIYKERAILAERVKLAMGGDRANPNVIEVIDIACDECPVGGYKVTDTCRGCLAHRCEDVCRRGAITFDAAHVAHMTKRSASNADNAQRYARTVRLWISSVRASVPARSVPSPCVRIWRHLSTMISVFPAVHAYISARLVQFRINLIFWIRSTS